MKNPRINWSRLKRKREEIFKKSSRKVMKDSNGLNLNYLDNTREKITKEE